MVPVVVLTRPREAVEMLTPRRVVAYDVSDLLAGGRRTPEELVAELRGNAPGGVEYEPRGTTLVATAHVAEHRKVAEALDFIRLIDRIDAERAASPSGPR